MNANLFSQNVVFCDSDYLALNKPIRVHSDEALESSLTQGATSEWSLVNRLDYESSGLLLFSKPSLVTSTRKLFQGSTANPQILKQYLVGASGPLSQQTLRARLVSGFICSRYRSSKKVLFTKELKKPRGWHSQQEVSHQVSPAPSSLECSFKGELYEVHLFSGARHQIRAFFKAEGVPLRGDRLYGGNDADRLELHAWRLKFKHPLSSKPYEIEAPLP